MAGVDGIVSGIDTATIVKELVAVSRRPIAKLQSQFTDLSAKRDAMTKLNSLLTSLQSAVEDVDTRSELSAYTVNSSSSSVVATASGDVVPGSYQIEVLQTATGSIERSNGFAAATDTIEPGDLSLDIGGTIISVRIDAATGTDTPQGLVQYLNENVAGANAFLLDTGNGANPFELVIQSSETGASNSVSSSYVADAAVPLGNTMSFTSVQSGDDAQVTIAGTTVYSATNSPSNIIPGVTLELTGATSGPVTISTTNDTAATQDKVQAVVDAYNELQSFIKKQTGSGDAEGGPLAGDSTMRSISRRMHSVLGSVAGQGTLSGLGALGLGSAQSGQLEFDGSEFVGALSGSGQDVMQMLTGPGGLFSELSEQLDLIVDPTDGLIQPRLESFESRMDDLADRVELQESRLTDYEQSLRDEFTAMELILAKYQATGDYLTQQLAALNNNNK